MIAKNNAILCPVSGTSCPNYVCRQFGCVAVGKLDEPAEATRAIGKPALDPTEENIRN